MVLRADNLVRVQHGDGQGDDRIKAQAGGHLELPVAPAEALQAASPGKRSNQQPHLFPGFRSLSDADSVNAMRVVLAVPATASRKLCICGVNSRRSASFCAKLNTQ